jgi:hypothetical protein
MAAVVLVVHLLLATALIGVVLIAARGVLSVALAVARLAA